MHASGQSGRIELLSDGLGCDAGEGWRKSATHVSFGSQGTKLVATYHADQVLGPVLADHRSASWHRPLSFIMRLRLHRGNALGSRSAVTHLDKAWFWVMELGWSGPAVLAASPADSVCSHMVLGARCQPDS